MSSVRVGHQALRLPDSRVLITGGYTTDLAFTTKTTDIYTPATTLTAPGEADLGSQVLDTPGGPVAVTVTNAGGNHLRLDGTATGRRSGVRLRADRR